MPEYRIIDGFPNYRAGDDGSVWTRLLQKRGGGIGDWKQLKPVKRRGYLRVGLRKEIGGKLCWRAVHHLVLEAFVGPRPDGMEGLHAPNPDRTDNRLENLRWGTSAENTADQFKAGTRAIGDKSPAAKLREADIPEVRRLIAERVSRREIGRRFGVSHAVINAVAKGTTWKHV